MKKPDIITKCYIKNLDITIIVYAYRKLTGTEIKQAIYFWKQNNPKKKIPKGGTIKIISIHGSED